MISVFWFLEEELNINKIMSENIITISNAFKFASKNNRNKYSQTNYQFIITSDIANIIKIS